MLILLCSPLSDTVQGSPSGDPGLLPRALDTVMNTVSNKHTMSHLRPCRLTGLEITPKNERLPPGKIPQVGFDPSTVRKTVMSGDVMHLMNRDETSEQQRQTRNLYVLRTADPVAVSFATFRGLRIFSMGLLCGGIQRKGV